MQRLPTREDEEGVDPAAVAEEDVGVEAVADHDHLGLVQLVPAPAEEMEADRVSQQGKQGPSWLVLTYCCTIASSMAASGLPTTIGSLPTQHVSAAVVAPPPG